MYKYSYVIIGILLFSIAQGCKKDLEFVSAWRQHEINIDGDDSEWHNHLTYFDEKSVAVGVKNDSTDVYLLLKTTDMKTKQLIMRNGFTVWLNAKGKKKETFGIRYPVGLNDYYPLQSDYARGRRDTEEEDILNKQFFNMLTEIEVIGPDDNKRNRFSKINPYGIEVGLTDTSGALIYELKVPLVATTGYNYQVGAEPGNVIRVGFETGKSERRESMGRRPGTGKGGGMGGMRGGGSGGRRPHDMDRPGDPVKFWMKLHIANDTLVDKHGK
jgi:hypothetical protein